MTLNYKPTFLNMELPFTSIHIFDFVIGNGLNCDAIVSYIENSLDRDWLTNMWFSCDNANH